MWTRTDLFINLFADDCKDFRVCTDFFRNKGRVNILFRELKNGLIKLNIPIWVYLYFVTDYRDMKTFSFCLDYVWQRPDAKESRYMSKSSMCQGNDANVNFLWQWSILPGLLCRAGLRSVSEKRVVYTAISSTFG